MLSNFAPLNAKAPLKMGQFGTINCSKTGQPNGFPKMILGLVVVPKPMIVTHFEPILVRCHSLSDAYHVRP